MPDQINLVISGDDNANHLSTYSAVLPGTGELQIYNIINAGGGDDELSLGSTPNIGVQFNGEGGNDTLSGKGASKTHEHYASGGEGDDIFYDWMTGITATLSGGAGWDTLGIYSKNATSVKNLTIDGFEELSIGRSIKATPHFLNQFQEINSYDDGGGDSLKITFTTGGTFEWKSASLTVSGELNGSKEADIVNLSAAEWGWDVSAGAGNDVITGSMGGDMLFGDVGNDRLFGGDSTDEINGYDGNDIIDGGAGRDDLMGMKGRDTFVFRALSGRDTIYGFEFDGSSRDRIDLSRIEGISSYRDLMANHVSKGNDSVVIEISKTDKIYLEGVHMSELMASGFIF